jgi:tetratricopeptide (TPR) repeat protein
MATGQQNLISMTSPRPISEPIAAATPADSMRLMAARSPSFSESSQPSIPQQLEPRGRGVVGKLGWLLLATILFGGVGALLYVALGERGARAPGNKLEAPPPANETAPPTPGSDSPSTKLEPVKPTPGSAAVAAVPGSLKLDEPEPPPRTAPPKKEAKVAYDDKNPKSMIKAADQLIRQKDFDQARTIYEKLERHRGYAGTALYQQALMAFKTGDNAAAEALAAKSISNLVNPGQKAVALLLYGDALFGRGAYDRAKNIYGKLYGTAKTKAEKESLAKKIMACNKGLKLPERDGL